MLIDVLEEQAMLRRTLLWIARREQAAYDRYAERQRMLRDQVFNAFDPINASEPFLEQLLSRTSYDSLSGKPRFLVLEIPRRGSPMIPLLAWKFDFALTPTEVRLRLGMFLHCMVGDEPCLVATGYRFEGPEYGPAGEAAPMSEHGYYHAQIINFFGVERSFDPAVNIEWLPTTQPAFPLDASGPVELVVAMLLTLYGLRFAQQELFPEVSGLAQFVSRTGYATSGAHGLGR